MLAHLLAGPDLVFSNFTKYVWIIVSGEFSVIPKR